MRLGQRSIEADAAVLSTLLQRPPGLDVTRMGAKGDGVTDDSAAIQAAIDTGLPVFVPASTYNLGTTSLNLNGPRQFHGAGMEATKFLYSGTGAGVVVNSGAGVTTAYYNIGGFTIDGGGVGAYGMRVGQPTTSPKSADGCVRDVRITGCVTAGLRASGPEICLFENVWCDNNAGDGAVFDDPTTLITTCQFISCIFRQNGGRGVYMQSGLSITFWGCLYEENGLEGFLLERPNDPSVVTRDITLERCYFEDNNYGRVGTGFYQFKAYTLGTSVIARCRLANSFFTGAGTGNKHIYLGRGTFIVDFAHFMNPATAAADTLDSTACTAIIRTQSDPSVEWNAGATALVGWILAEASAERPYWNNAGTPTEKVSVLEKVATVTGIDAKSVATTVLYAVPAGKTFIPTQVVVRVTAFTVGAKSIQAIASFGGNSSTYDDFANSVTHTVAANGVYLVNNAAATAQTVQAAADSFRLSIETGSDATTETYAVDVFGYLV